MKTTGKYILNAKGEPVPCNDLHKWGKWFESADRRVALTKSKNLEVSTVFLGIDHRFTGKGKPILWESMVFRKGKGGCEMRRCSGSREQAEAMHAQMEAEFLPKKYEKTKNETKT